MKLLVVCHEYPPLGTGAAGALWNLLPELATLDWDVQLVTSHFADLPQAEDDRGVNVIRIPCGRRRKVAPSGWELLRFLRRAPTALRQIIAEQSPYVVLAFFGIPAGWAAGRVCRNSGTPFVVALRGSDVPGYSQTRFGRLVRLARSRIVRVWQDSSAVVANSSWLRDLAISAWPNGHVQVIPNGVDAERFRARSGGNSTGHAESLRVLFVGQLVQRKGLDLLIKALAEVPGLLLDVVGDGPQSAACRTLAQRLNVAENIAWHGHLSRDMVTDCLANADVFALPTEAEGMSNTILEAMAAGLPIVTTTAGAVDLIQHSETGLVVERTPETLAEALAKLHDPQLRAKLGAAARVAAKQRSWSAVARQWDDLLREVVASSGGSP